MLNMLFHKMLSSAVAIVVITLTACGGGAGGHSSAAAELASRNLTPSDPAVAAIYNRSCRNCHTIAATGAPLTGDSTTWATLMSKGRETLVNNVVNGFGGMPPFGMCMDCDLEQFEALIDFMASPADKDQG
jgi:cytochrome c5